MKERLAKRELSTCTDRSRSANASRCLGCSPCRVSSTSVAEPVQLEAAVTFGGFIIFTYLSIGIMTLAMHDDLLAGERAAVTIALFGGLSWLSRLFTDLVVWRDEDWPPGELVFAGHVMLNGLFAMMTGIYLTFVAWQWLV